MTFGVRSTPRTDEGLAMRTDALVSRMFWLCLLALLCAAPTAFGQSSPTAAPTAGPALANPPDPAGAGAPKADGPLSNPIHLPYLTKRENFSGAMQLVVLLTVLSLAPAILIMMTSFTRIVIVMGLL